MYRRLKKLKKNRLIELLIASECSLTKAIISTEAILAEREPLISNDTRIRMIERMTQEIKRSYLDTKQHTRIGQCATRLEEISHG